MGAKKVFRIFLKSRGRKAIFFASFPRVFIKYLIIFSLLFNNNLPVSYSSNPAVNNEIIIKSDDPSLRVMAGAISEYINLLINTGTGEFEKNYVAERILIPRGTNGRHLFEHLYGFQKFDQNVNRAVALFEAIENPGGCNPPPRDFDLANPVSSELLEYKKASENPVEWDELRRSEAVIVYNAIKARDEQIVWDFHGFLRSASNYYDTIASVNGNIAFSELIERRTILKNALSDLASASVWFGFNKPQRYAEKMGAEENRYDAYVFYWNTLYWAFEVANLTNYSLDPPGGPSGQGVTTLNQEWTRKGWRKYDYEMTRSHYDCACQYHDTECIPTCSGVTCRDIISDYDACPSTWPGLSSSGSSTIPNTNSGGYWIGNIPISNVRNYFQAVYITGPNADLNPGCHQTRENAYVDQWEDLNNTFDAFKQARAVLDAALREYARIITGRNSESYEQLGPDGTDSFSWGGTYDYATFDVVFTEANQPPEADASALPEEVALNQNRTVGLDGSDTTDPENDSLTYRWVLTSLPETDFAVSSQYGTDQILAQSQSAALNLKAGPDLADPAGTWSVVMMVSDGKVENELPQSFSVSITADRKILSIHHDDKEIYLQQSTFGDFYSEVAPDSAFIFGNFSALEVFDPITGEAFRKGSPVDRINYSKNNVLKLTTGGQHLDRDLSGGKYDGLAGSTNLTGSTGAFEGWISIGPCFYYGSSCSFFPLISSYWVDLGVSPEKYATIYVDLFDEDIHFLCLPENDCSTGRAGTYKIEQWINHQAWLNPDGDGFSAYNVQTPDTPDWMERKAAEAINEASLYWPHVKTIESSDDDDGYGYYEPYGTTIWLNPKKKAMRLNKPACSGYGFCTGKTNDATALHESHHAYYFRSWMGFGPTPLIDEDGQDTLPRGGAQIDYLWDSAANAYGAYGPEADESVLGRPLSYTYEGDEIKDREQIGREKKMIDKYPLGMTPQTIDLDEKINPPLPANIPIESVTVNVYVYGYVISGSAYLDQIWDGTGYVSHKILDQKTPAPKLEIAISEEFENVLKNETADAHYSDLIVDYTIHIPHEVSEYDAEKYSGGQYDGKWNESNIG